jgi:hypothetical protein
MRFTKSEIAARKTAERTIVDPDASIQAKYHSRLILKSTRADAMARGAARNERRPDEPVRVHRVEVPPDPNAKAFLEALEAMLEREDETASAEAVQPGDPDTPDASVAPRASASELPTGGEICVLCLIPRGSCGHGGNQSDMR